MVNNLRIKTFTREGDKHLLNNERLANFTVSRTKNRKFDPVTGSQATSKILDNIVCNREAVVLP